jgi:SAM-dependent methyltransferase
MVWDKQYITSKKLWGEKPSEIAAFACSYLKESKRFQGQNDLFILDMGCGYGRDAVYLANHLPCHILGLDNSEQAIVLANEFISDILKKRIELLCFDFSIVRDKYDVIIASNLYHLLRPEERAKLRDTIKRCLKQNGLFFMNTLSVRDPQHSQGGTPVENEANSRIINNEAYIHLSSRKELEDDFGFLNISALFEREYDEHRSGEHSHQGDHPHHHVSWFMMGSLKEPGK